MLLIDPWGDDAATFAERLSPPRAVAAVLLSHAHSDHVGPICEIQRRNPSCKVYCVYELGHHLETELGIKNIVQVNFGGTVELPRGWAATFTPAVHSSGFFSKDGKVYSGGAPGGWVVRDETGFTVYHAGDTDVFMDMKLISDLHEPHVALLPIGDHYTMGPKSAGYALTHLLRTVRWCVPMHWGTFPVLTGTPDQLRLHIAREGVEVLNPPVGATLTLRL